MEKLLIHVEKSDGKLQYELKGEPVQLAHLLAELMYQDREFMAIAYVAIAAHERGLFDPSKKLHIV